MSAFWAQGDLDPKRAAVLVRNSVAILAQGDLDPKRAAVLVRNFDCTGRYPVFVYEKYVP